MAVERRREDFRRAVTKRWLRLLQVVHHLPASQTVEKKAPPGADVLHLVARRGVPPLDVVPRLSGLQMAAKKVPATVAALQLAVKHVVSERASWKQKGA